MPRQFDLYCWPGVQADEPLLMSWLQLGCFVLGLGMVVASYPAEFWPKLRQERVYQHLVFASLAALSVLWSIQAGIKDWLRTTFLAADHPGAVPWLSDCALAWAGAIIGLAAARQTGLAGQWAYYFLSQVLLPVLGSYVLFLWSYHRLSRQLFVYIFVAGFIGAALAIVLPVSRHRWLTLVRRSL